MDKARLFQSGRSEAVRLPKQYRFAGSEVVMEHFGNGVLLLPANDPWHTMQAGLAAFESGEAVDVVGTTKGCGFAGVVKRHNFGGGRASHGGSNTLRAPGSISFMRRQGKIIKGKRMAGHMGVDRKTVKKLELVRVDADAKIILVKGSIPGKSGSLVFVRKYI